MFNYLSKNIFLALLILITTYFLNYFFNNEINFYKEYIVYTVPFFIIYLLVQKNINLYFNFFIFSYLLSIITNNLSLFYFQIFLYSLVINLLFLFFISYFKDFNKKTILPTLLIYLFLSIFLIKEFLFFIELRLTDILFFYIIIAYYQLSFIVYIYNFFIFKFNSKNINNNKILLIESVISPFLIFFSIFKK